MEEFEGMLYALKVNAFEWAKQLVLAIVIFWIGMRVVKVMMRAVTKALTRQRFRNGTHHDLHHAHAYPEYNDGKNELLRPFECIYFQCIKHSFKFFHDSIFSVLR